MHLVDEHDVESVGRGDLLEHGFQALFEFPAELRAGDECPEVERHEALVAKPFRHVTTDDALGKPFRDRGFADARFTDEYRIVFRAP